MVVRVAAYRARDDDEFGRVVASSDLASEVGDVDYLVLAAPSTEQSRNLVDRRVLQRMKPSARLLNFGRGVLVNDDDLIEALEGGIIAGAALDVFRDEPLPSDHGFWTTKGLIISPHMSGIVPGWEDASVQIFLDTLRRWMNDEPLENILDKRKGYVVQDVRV
jgi:phosphoglycerate dehydrogenase-like enzyme